MREECYYDCEDGCISCQPLDCCEDAPVKSTMKQWVKKKKQETKMNYLNSNYAVACCPAQPEQKQEKLYMVDRLEMVKREKSDDLRRKFGLEDDEQPKTAEDFIQRIKDGKFVLRDHSWDPTFWGRVRWRDPELKEDHEGFDAANEELMDAFVNTMDEVVVLPEVDGLAALNEFKALN